MSTSPMVIDDGRTKSESETINKKTVLLAIVVVAVIILVGVLAGVLSAKREREKCDDRVKQAKLEKQGGESTTPPPEVSTQTPTKRPGDLKPWEKIRLPDDVRPVHYDMLLRTYLKTLNFSGCSNISISVTSATNIILFHVNKIEITEVAVVDTVGKSFAVQNKFASKENQFYVVILAEKLSVGNYVLRLDYKGNVETQELNGFYRSTYKNEAGDTRVLAATDFQPTDARKAFPCFDEPAMKATFTISIEHASEYLALSNMNAVSTERVSSTRILTKFAKSVRMPTYLVGYVVSDFKNLSSKTGEFKNITIRTWSTPEQYKDSAYALEIGRNVTTFLESYYGVPFPLPKQDMVALPDFNSGAMENWGIITYRETALLYKEGVSSETNKQRIAVIVAHELAHMWFGNLVSCSWWNDIWLNEGFASYVEYLGTHHAEPDWELMDQFLINDLHRAFRLDALVSSHPITVNVEQPEDVKTVFDAITYNKGSSIIRMLSDFLTEPLFQKGLQYYLQKYMFQSAETKDLWDALSYISKENVTRLMETWTDQMGYPVVMVTRNGPGKGKADQKHFLLDPNANVTEKSEFNYKWNIKFTYIVENETNSKSVWMHRSSATFEWPDGKWIKANHKQFGFYRVNYDRDNWEKLAQVLKDNYLSLDSADRTSLIDDALNLARAGQLDYDIPLNLSSYIKQETRYVPWKAFLTNMGFLETMLSTQDSYGKFQKYLLDSIESKIVEVGWNNSGHDKHLDVYMRSLILHTACANGHLTSNENAKRLFLEYLNNGRSLDVNLKSLIYHYGVANTGYEEWDELFDKYLNTTVASEKSKLLYGLSGSKEPWILRRFLRYSIDDDKIRAQDSVTVVSYVAGNPIGRELAWKFVKENWEIFYERYSKSSFRMASLITYSTSMMNTKIELEDVKSFFEGRDKGSGARAADQAIERVRTNIEWVERSAKAIADFLENI